MADKDYGLTTVADVGDERDYAHAVTRSGQETGDGRQSFDRYINFTAIINFGICLQAGWEANGLAMGSAFLNGGPAALIYGCIISTIGSTAVALSLAEMASIDPHVGAQYRWSIAFAQRWPEFWGLIQGWITIFAWTTAVAANIAQPANVAQSIIAFWNPSYSGAAWHATLMMWGLLLLTLFCNLYLRKILNALETLGGICHIIFWVAIIAIMATLGKRSTTEFVFTKLTSDVSGWNNPAICFNIGLLPTLLPLTGSDSIIHMVDETKDGHTRVPKSMIAAVLLNATMMFAYVLTILFCIGDYEAVSAARLPILEIYYQATHSKVAATVMVLMQTSILVLALFNCTASVSRLTWAFAKDKGLPFSDFFAKIHPTLKIPIPALGLCLVICFILALINIGSIVAFNAIISLCSLCLNLSCVIPIYLIIVRKVSGQHPRYGPFKLGRFGVPINLFALVFVTYSMIWVSFPTMKPITSETMNWAAPITLIVVGAGLIDWFTTGKRRFTVPQTNYGMEMKSNSFDTKGSA